MTMGKCPHGEFILTEGCPQCVAERRTADLAEQVKKKLVDEEVRVLPLVKVQYYSTTTGELSSREYTYYSVDRLAVGDIIMAPTGYSIAKAKVSTIDVPETEIASFRDKVKTIPSGSVVEDNPHTTDELSQVKIEAIAKDIERRRAKGIRPEQDEMEDGLNDEGLTLIDTKINLCDTCTEKNDYPICCPPDVTFGNGKGNDNIIQCSKYILGTAKPCSIPLNVLITPEPETALIKRPGVDIEVRNYYDEALKLLGYAEKRVIASLEDNQDANDDLALISKIEKQMEAKKKEKLEPSRVEAAAIRDTYNYLMNPILEAKKLTKDKMLIYHNEQKRIRAEQERINAERIKLAEDEMKLTGELSESVNLVEVMPEVSKRVSTDMGTSGQKDNWKWEVIDFSLVDDIYKMINPAILTPTAKSYKDTRTIPGIRIFNEPIIATRAR